MKDKIFWNGTIVGQEISKYIQELCQEYWEAGFNAGKCVSETSPAPKKKVFEITLGQLRYMKEREWLSENGLKELQEFEDSLNEEECKKDNKEDKA